MYSAARFMETNNFVSGNSVDELDVWTWSDILVALKHCQDSQQVATSSGVLQKWLDTLIVRLAMASEASPCGSISSTGSGCTASSKNGFSRATWWFEDLSVLSPILIQMLVKSMVSRKHNHVIISRFLFYYLKSKFHTASPDEKRRVLEIVFDMLYTLDPSSISCKSLFGVLRLVRCSNTSKSCRNKLESMIGSQIDQATLDDLLIPSPHGRSYRYDVNLVLRLLKVFLHGGGSELSPVQMKKVSSLIDQYIAEVAPDRCLKLSKFVALVTALPDSARDSWDELYHAMDIYLEVHAELSEEEKMKICCALNYEKLSSEACLHLSRNAKFPSKIHIRALVSQQSKLKSLRQGINNAKCCGDSPYRLTGIEGRAMEDEGSEKLRAQIQRMQWRLMELEKMCKKMQTQMTKIMKPKVSNHRTKRSLPRLCS
ncbi:hypothetical protein like AT3G22104 [Hibiscus trionum]|uniref:NPH3 domain-containing protein n=1 Tax=Hibiscus trionum TaxID=183268 RepID=A0A9W7MRK8_HIBTR|nr:hypothetical protein like AT3G22104 [Hibiscus trionum]